MGIKVCKFGGSSLADAGQIGKVREIIAADSERRYIVPSAPGKRNKEDQKITDLLYLCHKHAEQGLGFDTVFDLIRARYTEIVAGLGLSLDMGPHLDEVRERIAGGESADYAASRGEYLNGIIIAELLGYAFIDPAEIIRFNEHGRFDAEGTQAVASQRLKAAERAVVPGFFGSMPDGKVKTFSRGGSDVTGAIVARAAGASVYENWTDVSGMLMADPRVVEKPRPIEVITYKELRELAYMGATVLHDEAIFPVRQAGIPVNIRNTNRPDDAGTMIVREDDAPPFEAGSSALTGIAGRTDFTVISIYKALANSEQGYARRILEAVENNDVSFEHMPSGIDTVSVVIADSELEGGKLDEVMEDIRNAVEPDEIEAQPNMALIATVGRGMMHTPGMAAKLFTAVADADVSIRMIDQGSSELNIIIGVGAIDFEKAMRAIYAAFVKP